MLNKEMAKIDWENKNAQEIKNLVRGLNPLMGAYTFLNEKKIKFWKVKYIEKDVVAKPGEVILANPKEGLEIMTKSEVISVLEIQGENSKRMSIGDYLRGNKIELGEIFK